MGEEEAEEEEEIVGSGVVFDVWIFMLVLLYVYGSGRKYERRFLSLVFLISIRLLYSINRFSYPGIFNVHTRSLHSPSNAFLTRYF